MRSMKFLNLMTLFLIVLFAESSAQSRYIYKVKYGFLTAGSARLEFNTVSDTLLSRFSIKSSPWLSRLWKLNDSIESSYDLSSERLITHHKRIREGKYHREYNAVFSWEDSLVTVNTKPMALVFPNLLDIPSLLHRLRQVELTVGDTLIYHLFDGQGTGRLSLLIQKMESVEVNNRKVSTFVMIPLERNQKADENDLSLSIWLSANAPHDPVRLAIETRYGSAIMTLEGN